MKRNTLREITGVSSLENASPLPLGEYNWKNNNKYLYSIVHSFIDIYGFEKSQPKKWSVFARYKQILMTQEQRGGTIGIYSIGVKMTLKVGSTPMETTLSNKRL